MVTKSKGSRRGTRRKFLAKKRRIRDLITNFKPGERIHVDIDSSRNPPHPRFQGLVGNILEKRGESYLIKVKDQNKEKKLVLGPEHLKR